MVRLDGGLFFATADALHDRLREIAEDSDPPLRAVVLDLEGVKEPVLTVLEADGVVERIGADHVHDRIPEAIGAARNALVG